MPLLHAKTLMKPAIPRCLLLSLLVLLGTCACATGGHGKRNQQDLIRGAFQSPDKIYLLGDARDYEIKPEGFAAYQALAQSPLKDAVLCGGMEANLWFGLDAGAPQVFGRYMLLLDAARITPAQAEAFRLTSLQVDTRSPMRDQPWAYRVAADPRCGLPTGQLQLYSATFEGNGRVVQLQDREALLAASALPQPLRLNLRLEGRALEQSGPLDSVGAVVTAPIYLLGILFRTKSL